MKTFATLFPDAENVHLIKDVGQIPYMMHRLFGYDSSILVYSNDIEYAHLKDAVKGLKVSYLKRGMNLRWFNIGVVSFLLRNARSVDVLNLYHDTLASKLYAWVYKRVNPNGFAYIKLDGNAKDLRATQANMALHSSFRNWMLNVLQRQFEKCVDGVSIETAEALEIYRELYPGMASKMLFLPNGIDEQYVHAQRRVRPFERKENLIITVGRLGSAQKNTELFMSAVGKLRSLGDWKVCLIGSRTPEFDLWMAEFLRQHAEHAGAIELVGELASRDQLYDWYDRAKIFVLSSRYEGFPLVFPEAIFFGNVIITTDVSGAQDITDGGRVGKIIPVEDAAALAAAIEAAIADETYLRDASEAAVNYSRKKYVWSSILVPLENLISRSHV
jgi:glycosyltransferase involved in cell wall biosynthesis